MNISYWRLISNNPTFRLLWFAQMASFIGDWFNSIALMDFVSTPRLSGIDESGIYISLVLICSFFPYFIVGPIAGIIVDRYNRKTILIISDIIRGVLVLGYIPVYYISPEHIWLLYAIEIVVFSVSSFFLSSKAAILPSICKNPNELISANTLGQITWGLMIAIGGFLGGIAVKELGFVNAIIINSMTFFISSAFIYFMIYNDERETHPHNTDHTRKKRNSWREFKEGVSFILKNRFVSALLLVKPGWAIGGGAVLMLHVVFAKQVFNEGSYGIGIFFLCRGVGVLIGSYFGKKVYKYTEKVSVFRFVSAIFVCYSIFYGLFSVMPNIGSAAIMLILATSFSANLWFFSRNTLQLIVPNELRGRVFSHDEGLSDLMMMLSALGAGIALDYFDVAPRTISLAAAVLMLGCGVLFFIGLVSRILPNKPVLAEKNLQ